MDERISNCSKGIWKPRDPCGLEILKLPTLLNKWGKDHPTIKFNLLGEVLNVGFDFSPHRLRRDTILYCRDEFCFVLYPVHNDRIDNFS